MDVWMRFTLAAFAGWRIAHLLAKEDGPWDLIVRLRKAAGDGFLGGLMDCFQCVSLWVAAPLMFFVTQDVVQWFVAWLALSGAACLLESVVGDEPPWMRATPGLTEGQGRSHDGLLRPETGRGEPVNGTP